MTDNFINIEIANIYLVDILGPITWGGNIGPSPALLCPIPVVLVQP